jgi:hypothetical protein
MEFYDQLSNCKLPKKEFFVHDDAPENYDAIPLVL